MRQLNSASNKLREAMCFYAREIANDMLLYEEIRENTQEEILTNKIRRNKNEELRVNIHSQSTASLVAYEINSIRWCKSRTPPPIICSRQSQTSHLR